MSYASFDSQRRFTDARRLAAYHDFVQYITRHASTLVPFEEVRTRLRNKSEIQRGTQLIPLNAIVGSVGRYRDFTRDFLPRDEALEARWRRVDEAMNGLSGLPAIDVYQLGDVYFVRDGNHRVSVARANGVSHIEANVVEIPLKAPLTPDMDVDQIILATEKADFLDRTNLDALRPDVLIEFTAPGRYAELLDHIEDHRWYLGLERNTEVSHADAVCSWYDHVYQPAVKAIRTSGFLADFPKRTEADLYLWSMRHLAELKEQYSDAVDTQMAVQDLARQNHPQPLKPFSNVVRAVRDLVTGHDDVSPIVEELVNKLSERERDQGEAH